MRTRLIGASQLLPQTGNPFFTIGHFGAATTFGNRQRLIPLHIRPIGKVPDPDFDAGCRCLQQLKEKFDRLPLALMKLDIELFVSNLSRDDGVVRKPAKQVATLPAQRGLGTPIDKLPNQPILLASNLVATQQAIAAALVRQHGIDGQYQCQRIALHLIKRQHNASLNPVLQIAHQYIVTGRVARVILIIRMLPLI